MMKRNLCILIAIFLGGCLGTHMSAQVRDLSFMAGVNAPLNKEVGSGVVFNLNYGGFTRSGIGFRMGLQWMPEVAEVDHAFGFPVALAYRTKARSGAERLVSGAVGAIGAIGYDAISGDDSDDMARDALGGFLLNLFRDMEFSAGVTPGYVFGKPGPASRATWGDSWQYWEDSWTEKPRDFSLSLDAGVCLNYSLWRFDLKVMPAIHYYLFDNFVYRTASGEVGVGETDFQEQPLRWFLTVSAGLAFRF